MKKFKGLWVNLYKQIGSWYKKWLGVVTEWLNLLIKFTLTSVKILLPILLVVLIAVYAYKLFDRNEINAHEVRLYVWLFLLFNLVLLFAVLRLYNAIVSNTRYLLTLDRSLKRYQKEMHNLFMLFQKAANNFKYSFGKSEVIVAKLVKITNNLLLYIKNNKNEKE